MSTSPGPPVPVPQTAGTPVAGRLTEADEWPRHQIARTFDTVASDSPHWSDGYYFTASDDAGTASAAILGAALAAVVRTVAGTTEPERAWRITCELASAALPS